MANEPTPSDERIPRGALIVVAVGLVACLAAWLLSTDKSYGVAAELEWIERGPIRASEAAQVPGGGGRMQLLEGEIAATGTNVAGYVLFRVFSTLRIEAGSPVEGATVLCETKGGPRSEIARSTGGLRALYPRSSEDGIYGQNVPEVLLIQFSARGGTAVRVDAEDLRIPRFTTEQGVKLEWPEYRIGRERLEYTIAGGPPEQDLDLPFYSIWKGTGVPSARVSCTLRTGAGESTVSTRGALEGRTAPIDESAEDAREEFEQEEREREEEAEGGGEEE